MRKHTALRALLLTALLAGTATWARAQVAVPELAPAGVRIFSSRFPISPMNNLVPENPAALQWGGPSRVGGGALRGDKSDALDGDSLRYRGSFAGFRWIKQRVALAADTMNYAVDMAQPIGSPAHLERKEQAAAMSFSLPESLAWGVGSRSVTLDGSGPNTSHVDANGWVFGLSLRLGEYFFAGAGLGHDSASANLPPGGGLPAFVGDLERDHRMVGIGLRGNGSVVWRLEADSFHREDYRDGLGGLHLPGYDLALYSAEVQFGNWLFGYAAYDASDFQPLGARIKGYSVDFGLAPFGGPTLTGRSELTRQEIGGAQTSLERINSVALLWQF